MHTDGGCVVGDAEWKIAQTLAERVEGECGYLRYVRNIVQSVGSDKSQFGVGVGGEDHLTACPPHTQQDGDALPVRGKQHGNFAAGLESELVANHVRCLCRPIGQSARRQFDALAGGVVVVGHARAGRVGSQDRSEEGVGQVVYRRRHVVSLRSRSVHTIFQLTQRGPLEAASIGGPGGAGVGLVSVVLDDSVVLVAPSGGDTASADCGPL